MNVLRDISVILLAAEAFFFSLIPLLLFGASVYGVWRLRRHRNLPTWLTRLRGYVVLAQSYVESAMDALVAPVVAMHSAFATVDGWLRALRREADR